MPSLRTLAPAVLVATLTFTGCAHEKSGSESAADGGSHSTSAQALTENQRFAAKSLTALENPLKHIESCDDVERVLASHLEGLRAEPTNTVDGWGVFCDWAATAEDHDDTALRSIGVALSVMPSATVTPDPDTLMQTEGGALHDDPWLSERGGVATSLTVNNNADAVTITTVWLPGLEATITAGHRGTNSELDGTNALAVVQQLVR